MKSNGSVYYRKSDKRYVGKYMLPPDPITDERKPKYVYGETNVKESRAEKQKVVAKLNNLIAEVESGNFSNVHKMTVEGYLNNWINIHAKDDGIAKTTEQGYRIYITKHINPFLGKILLSELKPLQIEAFYKKEKVKGYKEKTILQSHRILHKALKTAMKNGLIGNNVCDLVDAPSPEKFKINMYDENKYNLLVEAFKGTDLEIPVLLAGMCGLRRGEVLGLRWQDIDNETLTVFQTVVVANKKIIIKPPKSETSLRTITLPSIIIPILKRKRGIGLVCPDEHGNPQHPGTFSKKFAAALADKELEHIRFHDLRHFNATMMLKRGITDKEASERLGHSDPNITKKVYQYVLKEMDKKSANKLNDILKVKID